MIFALFDLSQFSSVYKLFLQAGCPSCHLTNSVKALKATRIMVPNFVKIGQTVFELS